MHYTPILLLTILTIFTLASPLKDNQIRSPAPFEAVAEGFDPGVSTAAEAIADSNAANQTHFDKRYLPAEVDADTAVANGVGDVEPDVEADEADVEADEAAVADGGFH
ncbi:hypothetical protein P7C71_g2878, partial [Lecanoromycetidae sp. Uapishka_2]